MEDGLAVFRGGRKLHAFAEKVLKNGSYRSLKGPVLSADFISVVLWFYKMIGLFWEGWHDFFSWRG